MADSADPVDMLDEALASGRILIAVLQDGETWTTLHGLTVLAVTQAELDALDNGTLLARDLDYRHAVAVREEEADDGQP